MKKKIFSLLMVMVLVLGMATSVSAAMVGSDWLEDPFYNSPFYDNTPEIGDFVWTGIAYEFENEEDKSTCSVVGLCAENTWNYISIPASVNGITVTAIADAFKDNTTIEGLFIPTTVKMIDTYSFYNCKNLKTITYAGVSYTDVEAFMSAYVGNGGKFGSDDPTSFEFAGTGLTGAKPVVEELDVTWSTTNPWYVEVDDLVTDNDDYQCFVDVLKDGKYVGNTGLWEPADDGKVVFDLSCFVAMSGSGKYTAEVSVVDMEKHVPVAYGTAVCVYEKPEKQLAAPANVKVDLENDKIVFDQVEGAHVYYIWAWETYGSEGYDYVFDRIVDENTSDGKAECDLVGFAEYVDYLKEEATNQDINITFGVIAVSENINTVAASDCVKCVGYENKVTKEQAKENFDEAFEALESEDADPVPVLEALKGVSNETITELLETDAEFVEKVEKLDDFLIEEMGDSYKGATSKTELVDASKVSIMGVAINGIGYNSAELAFAAPEKEATVPTGYEKGVQLDISLMVDGDAMEDLSVPVTITMPIPAGVDTKDLVILHYHGDATTPVVIVPTVNADGTMTFIVDGFSTFVVTNETVEKEPEAGGTGTATPEPETPGTETPGTEAPEAPKTGDASGKTLICSLLLLAVGVVLVMKRNSFAK